MPLRLPDGTRVVLGAASTLRYSATFGAAREVVLDGEGYFEVVHDPRHPFRVRAGDAVAEDIGTAFGVRAYPRDGTVRVVVATGAVALHSARDSSAPRAMLRPGQRGALRRGETRVAVDSAELSSALAWLRGALAFDDAPLPEVVAELERWYDVRIRIGDSTLATRRLTASFPSATLADVLAALAPALDLRYARDADTLVVLARSGRR
ncbi:MAG: DUF4974 domain-containing protein [Gemmatimonadaceae bacterium]|nr:DUF4974 domain-containing protein [Gemmatimonadaceae bacterium]